MTVILKFLLKTKSLLNTWENGLFRVSCGALQALLHSLVGETFPEKLQKSYLPIKSHYPQCLAKLKELPELLTSSSIMKLEYKTASGLYGREKCQLSTLILKRWLMLMLLFQRSIPWDISKSCVLGFQNIVHSFCAVLQVQEKLWPWCQL